MGHPFNFCDYMVCRVDKVLIERQTGTGTQELQERTFPVGEVVDLNTRSFVWNDGCEIAFCESS